MTNLELLKSYSVLSDLQKKEQMYFAETGEKLFKGRIKITYAIAVNMKNFLEALRPRDMVLKELTEEYRDSEKEENGIMVFKEGKNKDDYWTKVSELNNLENEVNIRKVNIDEFDGLNLDSFELESMMFMIE